MRSKQTVEHQYSEEEMCLDDLKARAALELRNAPVIFALMDRLNRESLAEYDTAANMERVRYIHGKRAVCNVFLEIEDEVDGQKIANARRAEDLKTLDMG